MKQNHVELLIMAALIATLLSLFLIVYIIIDNRKKAREKRLSKSLKEYERMQMQREERTAATNRITNIIAHDIRNPLTNINLATDQLRNNEVINEELIPLLNVINRNSQRINILVGNLIASFKSLQLELAVVDIHQLIDEVLELLKDHINLYGITIKNQYSETPCMVNVDMERMKIAIFNIIINAIEATEPGKGTLIIKSSRQEGNCKIDFTDDGGGMDEEIIEKVFEPYYSNKSKGSGLGLSSTRNIIKNHNGHIDVESKKGKGTTFTILLKEVKDL